MGSALGSMEGAGIPVMPAFGLGIGTANVETTIRIGGQSATAASVVGAGCMGNSMRIY